MKNGKFEAADIYNLLAKRYADSRQWICAREVANTTGGGRRRLDFVAANCYESKDFGVHAFEVKISREDLRRELLDAEKHTMFYDDIDTYTIVAPDYVLNPEMRKLVPKRWGILIADAFKDESFEGGYQTELRCFRRPLELHDTQESKRVLSRGFVMSMLRAMSNQDVKCHPIDELAKARADAYDEGYRHGKQNGGDYLARYEEIKWAKGLADDLRIYSAQEYDKQRPAVMFLRAMLGEAQWFRSRMNTLKAAAEELEKAWNNMLKMNQEGGAECK